MELLEKDFGAKIVTFNPKLRPRCLIPISIQLVRTRIDLDLEPETVPRNITGSLKSPSRLTPQYDGVIT